MKLKNKDKQKLKKERNTFMRKQSPMGTLKKVVFDRINPTYLFNICLTQNLIAN